LESLQRIKMKSLRDYLEESEHAAENPVTGDVFAINIREECLVESVVLEHAEDGIVIAADDRMLEIFESYGITVEDVCMECGLTECGCVHEGEADEHLDEFAAGMLAKAALPFAAGAAMGAMADNDTNEARDPGEYDQEGDMAKTELHTMIRAARKLIGMLGDDDNMPEWTQKKITKATDYVDTAADYIASQKERGVMEQGVAEGSSTTWEVNFDYGPHMSDSVKVKADSEEEAIAKVEKAAERKGRSIMINWAEPVEQDMAEATPETTVSALRGYKTWQVWIKNNYYNGKYPDYSARPYRVIAGSADEARQVVLDNADRILNDLLSKKFPSGKRVLPPRSALPIEAKHIGAVDDGTEKGRVTTSRPITMLSPQGPMTVMLDAGNIVDVEQGVEESKYPWLDAAKPPKQPDAPRLVRDRKTGKEYDPHDEFAKAMNSPEVRAQMKRMSQRESVAEGPEETSPVARAVLHRIMMAHPGVLATHGPERVMSAVDELADRVNIGPDDEIGTSDVSGWVRDVIRMLSELPDESMSDVDALDEAEKKGLYYNVNNRKQAGTSRDKNHPKAPTAQAWKDAAKTAKTEGYEIDEAEYQGRKVQLGKPTRGDVKKFKVFVKDPGTGNVKKVNFGDPNMKIRKSNPGARKSFRARHNCDTAKDRTTARYWSCRKW